MGNSGYISDHEKERLSKFYNTMEEDLITSEPSFTFDMWNLILELLNENGKSAKRRLIDVGGGTGRLSRIGFKHGFDVYLTDILPELLDIAVTKYNEFEGRTYILDIFDPKSVDEFIDAHGYFDVVLCLGFVINHTDSLEKTETAFFNLVKLMNNGAVLVLDALIRELYMGSPLVIWDRLTNTLIPISTLLKYFKKYGLILKYLHSLEYSYSKPNYHYMDRGIRFFLVKAW